MFNAKVGIAILTSNIYAKKKKKKKKKNTLKAFNDSQFSFFLIHLKLNIKTNTNYFIQIIY